MGKRSWSLVLATALIAGVFSALPAKAQEAPTAVVPAVVNIEDPQGDANYINDQGVGLPVPGDQVGTDQFGTVSDILKGWLSSDATTVSAHIVTNAAPPASTPLIFHMRVDPGSGTNCLWFRASFPSAAQGQTDPVVPQAASLRDTCTDDVTTDGELTVGTTADGDGVITITVPKSASAAFTDGTVLKTPTADSRNFPGGVVTLPQVDNTLPGTDFTITSGGAGPAPVPAPSADPAPEPKPKPKPKKCKNGNNGSNSKKCKPKKPKPETPVTPTSSCPAYVPGEEGATALTSIVTAAATEDKPVEVTIDAPTGDPVSLPAAFQNIQVDAAAAEAGLYVRYEFPVEEDHDIYLDYADGSEAAHAGGFNPAPFVPANPVLGTDGTGAGGHSEQGAEQLDGIRSADCAGYTLQMDSFVSMGGEMTLKLWLGEPVNDPAPPGGALSFFYDMTGLRSPVAGSAQASGTPAATKGCTKGKGKKKGCTKPPVASCAAFTPGEAGTDKPLVTLTDAATEAAPVEQKVTLDMSGGDLDVVGTGALPPSSDIFNIQVDGANPDAGLYVLFEFPERRDYDLNLLHTDGSYAARSRSFNTIYESKDAPIPLSDPGYGGAGTPSSEKLDGIRTADCGGWTLDVENWLGEGGEMTVKMWLGEAKIDPQAPGTETP